MNWIKNWITWKFLTLCTDIHDPASKDQIRFDHSWSWPLLFQFSKTSNEVGLYFLSSAKLHLKLAYIFSVRPNFSLSWPLFSQFIKTSVEVGLYFFSSAKLQMKLASFISVWQNLRLSGPLFSQLSKTSDEVGLIYFSLTKLKVKLTSIFIGELRIIESWA